MTIKHDQEKARWDLLPWRAVSEVVAVLTFGATKYDDNNWQTVPGLRRRYVAASMRHVVAWRLGEQRDPETGLHHLAHAICCLLFITSHELGNDPEEEQHENRPDHPHPAPARLGARLVRSLDPRERRRKRRA